MSDDGNKQREVENVTTSYKWICCWNQQLIEMDIERETLELEPAEEKVNGDFELQLMLNICREMENDKQIQMSLSMFQVCRWMKSRKIWIDV